METLLDELYYEGPKVYASAELATEADLFRNRTALFYTPTEEIPPEWVGEGKLDITLPLPPQRYSSGLKFLLTAYRAYGSI